MSTFKLPLFYVFTIALLAKLSLQAAVINTPPGVRQCIPAMLTWNSSTGTVYISAYNGNNTSAAPILTFDPFPATTQSFTWKPVFPAGTPITFGITDDTGVTNYSGTLTVQEGGKTDCIKSNDPAIGKVSGSTTGGVMPASMAPGAGSSAGPNSGSGSGSASIGSTVTAPPSVKDEGSDSKTSPSSVSGESPDHSKPSTGNSSINGITPVTGTDGSSSASRTSNTTAQNSSVDPLVKADSAKALALLITVGSSIVLFF